MALSRGVVRFAVAGPRALWARLRRMWPPAQEVSGLRMETEPGPTPFGAGSAPFGAGSAAVRRTRTRSVTGLPRPAGTRVRRSRTRRPVAWIAPAGRSRARRSWAWRSRLGRSSARSPVVAGHEASRPGAGRSPVRGGPGSRARGTAAERPAPRPGPAARGVATAGIPIAARPVSHSLRPPAVASAGRPGCPRRQSLDRQARRAGGPTRPSHAPPEPRHGPR
jgi:hypothetical protein